MLAHPSTAQSHDATDLDDDALLVRLQRLVAQDRTITARLLVHLAEVDARGLYRAHAYASMFEYAVHALHMSESEAYVRIRTARLSRQFPAILPLIERNEVHLSALKLLAPVLTDDNCDELLENARFKTKTQIEAMLAQRFAKPDVPSTIRKLPVRSSEPRPAQLPTPSTTAMGSRAPSASTEAMAREPKSTVTSDAPSSTTSQLATFQLASPPALPAVTPLSADRYKVQFTADRRLHDKLKQAQDLLRHQAPDGDVAVVVERALDLLIADRLKHRFAVGQKSRPTRAVSEAKAGSRHIPHDVRRAVISRDGTQCTYTSRDGRRCQQRGLLELHHEEPHGRGGPSTVRNVRVLCRAHNQLLAERDYGRGFMRQRIGARNGRAT